MKRNESEQENKKEMIGNHGLSIEVTHIFRKMKNEIIQVYSSDFVFVFVFLYLKNVFFVCYYFMYYFMFNIVWK